MREKFLVVGSGVSGIAASELLDREGLDFVLYDQNGDLDVEALRKKSESLRDAEIIVGDIDLLELSEYKEAVLSPGVPIDKPLAIALREGGVSLIGEIELAYRYAKGRLCAITGTNGKTTTTALVGELLKKGYSDVHVVGNIGIPYTSVAADTTDESACALEVSSFQLETIHEFRAGVSAILNITPDHLDRHHTMEAYAGAKERIAENAEKDDVIVLNYEDERLREFADTVNCRVVFFSSERELEDGFFVRDGVLMSASDGRAEVWLPVTELSILGKHNHENALAAMAMAQAMGISKEEIVEGLKSFQAVEHRIEFVCETKGVRFYNDSKGTNPDAAIKAVTAMDRPICLIGGGYDKSASYDEWIESFDGRVRHLVLIGETAEKIAACADSHGFKDYEYADSLEDAVAAAFHAAKEGDCVLLSPACASWDMFKNFEVRGTLFKEYARKL